MIATVEAKGLLKTLAGGAPNVPPTREAADALKRLNPK